LQEELAAAWNERMAWYQTRFQPNVAIQNARLARLNSHLARDGRIASKDGDISNFLDALEDSQQASAERSAPALQRRTTTRRRWESAAAAGVADCSRKVAEVVAVNPAPRHVNPRLNRSFRPTAHVNLAGAGAVARRAPTSSPKPIPGNASNPLSRPCAPCRRTRPYGVYLQQRRTFGNSAAFFIDCADYLARFCDRAQAARVLTDAITILPDDAQLVRLVARRLDRLGVATWPSRCSNG